MQELLAATLLLACAQASRQGFAEVGEPADRFMGTAATNFIQWSADSETLLAGAQNGDLLLFDVESGVLAARIPGGDSFCAFATFLPGEKQVAGSDHAGRLTIYDRATGLRPKVCCGCSISRASRSGPSGADAARTFTWRRGS